MTDYRVAYNKTTRTATVQLVGDSLPSGSTQVGTFSHPSTEYMDQAVAFHYVRDILYKRSASNPDNAGFWPNNITDMTSIAIVLDESVDLTSLDLDPATVSLTVGETQQLTATKTPTVATGTPTYTSSDPDKATVSATGLVTAIAEGTATITATLQGKTATSDITVTA
jgi:uncharacterized protein YjdB